MPNNLATMIGQAIHLCGALELLVNNGIHALGKDELLVRQVMACGFSQRIRIFGELLKNRSSLKPDDIDSLCKELRGIAEMRNKIAHNPIVSDQPNMESPYILIVRNAPDKIEKMSAADVKNFVNQTNAVIERLPKLLPECVNREKT
jgi:hypothetical protein